MGKSAKIRHRRRRRAEVFEVNEQRRWLAQIADWKRRGLWGFDKCVTVRDDEGKLLLHITRGGFGYF